MLLTSLVLIIAIASFVAGVMYTKLSAGQSSMDMEDDTGDSIHIKIAPLATTLMT